MGQVSGLLLSLPWVVRVSRQCFTGQLSHCWYISLDSSSCLIFSITEGCFSSRRIREVLALAVVKKAANMSSIADSWERKECFDKFECHFKLVVIQTVPTFCRFCPCAGGFSLPLALHKPAPNLGWQRPKQDTLLPFLYKLDIHLPSD